MIMPLIQARRHFLEVGLHVAGGIETGSAEFTFNNIALPPAQWGRLAVFIASHSASTTGSQVVNFVSLGDFPFIMAIQSHIGSVPWQGVSLGYAYIHDFIGDAATLFFGVNKSTARYRWDLYVFPTADLIDFDRSLREGDNPDAHSIVLDVVANGLVVGNGATRDEEPYVPLEGVDIIDARYSHSGGQATTTRGITGRKETAAAGTHTLSQAESNETEMTQSSIVGASVRLEHTIQEAEPRPLPFQKDLEFHFDASAGVTTDGSGGVSNWENRGSKHNAVQSNSSNRPTLATGGLNGRPYLVLDPSNEQFFEDIDFQQPSGFTSLTPYTVLAVVDQVAGLEDFPSLFGSTASAGGKMGVYFRSTEDEQLRAFKTDYAAGNLVTPSVVAFRISSFGGTSNPARYRVNNAAYSSTSTANANSSSISQTQFLRNTGLGSSDGYFNGHLYEIALYSRAISIEELDFTMNVLMDKYGLS